MIDFVKGVTGRKRGAGGLQLINNLTDILPVSLSRQKDRDVAGLSGSEGRRRLDGAKTPTRLEQVQRCLASASRDSEFKALVKRADQLRDSGEWGAAEQAYRQALARRPFHSGYRVQLAHMLKEQRKWLESEVNYRSAIAIGGEIADIRIHLGFVASVNGRSAQFVEPRLDTAPFLASPSEPDLKVLGAICFHDANHMGAEMMVRLITECRSNRDALLAMIASEKFEKPNKILLSILRKKYD